jgi:predicted O-linked N-acetylglucosamine transferase (SPINDLY family)
LTALGLTQLITASMAEYEEAALRLARQPDDLAVLRRRLEAARTVTSVFDPVRCARDIEAAFTRMWQLRNGGQAPQAFSV